MTQQFSAFYDLLMPELPGCTTGMLDAHLLAVAREFCERSSAWRADLSPLAITATNLSYPLFAPESKAEAFRLLELTVNDQLWWRAREPEDKDNRQPRFQAHEPPFTVSQALTDFTLTESADGTLTGVAALRPTYTANVLPDVLLLQHAQAIRTGVLSRLMLMGGKKWSDRELGSDYRNQYEARINTAATVAARGNTRGLMRTRKTFI